MERRIAVRPIRWTEKLTVLPPIFDPHERLAELVAGDRSSYAGLSRMIGRPDGFLRRFAVERVPSRLGERDRQLLAAFFGVGEHELGGPPPARPTKYRERRCASRI